MSNEIEREQMQFLADSARAALGGDASLVIVIRDGEDSFQTVGNMSLPDKEMFTWLMQGVLAFVGGKMRGSGVELVLRDKETRKEISFCEEN